MIPLHDNIPSRTTPLVNYVLIGICSLAFAAQLAQGPASELVERYGFIPARLSQPDAPLVVERPEVLMTPRGPAIVMREETLLEPAIAVPWTLITCMFLHGGWMHFLGNMWFLWIFGDNVEDRLGHVAYLLLYMGTGVAAGLAHAASDWTSPVPTIGASGAIAGVMGAYALLYPHAKVLALIPLVVILQTIVLPAPVFLGIWFIMQLASGSMSSGEGGGVAWWAHIGGFIAGAAVALIIHQTGWDRSPVTERRPGEEESGMGRRMRFF